MKLRIYIIALFLLGGFAGPVHAQSVGVEIKPELTTVYAKPGSTVKIPVVVKNTGNQGSFKANALTLVPNGSQGDLIPAPGLVRGITVDPLLIEPFFLPTGAQKNIEMTITIDPRLSARDYYLGMNITSVGKKRSEGKSSLAIELNVLSTVLLTVTNDGTMTISGYINSFTAGNKSNVRFFDSTQDIPLTLSMHNSGNNWMYTSGVIAVSNMFGKKDLIKIPEQRILADSKRLVRSSQTNSPQHTAILQGMHFGKYTATARMAIEGKNTMATKTITFIALPFRLVGALMLLGIIALLTGVGVNRRSPPQRVHPHQL